MDYLDYKAQVKLLRGREVKKDIRKGKREVEALPGPGTSETTHVASVSQELIHWIYAYLLAAIDAKRGKDIIIDLGVMSHMTLHQEWFFTI